MFADIQTIVDYNAVYKDNARWLTVMQAICLRHGLPASELKRQTTGSAIVYATAGRIIKLYAPIWPEEIHRERLGLKHCQNRLDLPIPALEAEGQIGGWPYLILQQLPGKMIREVWRHLDLAEKQALMAQAGECIAQLHALPPVSDPWLDQDWSSFCQERLAAFPKQQAKYGLEEPLLSIFTQALAEGIANLSMSPSIFLHCDLTDDHFLVDYQAGKWKITGLIDFADAMQGHFLYEFAAPLVLLAQGQIALKRTLLRAYGLTDLDEALESQLLTQILVHRFANIAWYLKHYLPQSIKSLEDFKNYYCGLRT